MRLTTSIFLFFFLVIFSSFTYAECSSPPIVMEISGIIKNEYGAEISQVVNVTLENINQSAITKITTNYDTPSHYKISVNTCDSNEKVILTFNNLEHNITIKNYENNTYNFTELGIITNLNPRLNMTYTSIHQPNVYSTPITESTEGIEYNYTLNFELYNNISSVTLTLIESPDSMNITGYTLLWTPNQSDVDHGQYNITINISDSVSSSIHNYTLNVLNINQAPKIRSTPISSGKEEIQYTYIINATDEDHDNLTYSLFDEPNGMNITSEGVLTWTPSIGQAGNYLITINVSDGEYSEIQEWMLYISITNNNLPIISSNPKTESYVDYEYTYQIIATDADNEQLNYYVDVNFGSPYIDSLGILHFTPSIEDMAHSPITFQIRVVDSKFGSSSQIFYLKILNETPQTQSSTTQLKSSASKISTISNINIPKIDVNTSIKGILINETTSTQTLLFNLQNTNINSIIITSEKNENSNNTNILFQVFNSKPQNLKTLDMYTYKYFYLSQEYTNLKIINADISFSIESSFFEKNNLTTNDITLFTYNNFNWEAMPTEFISKTSSNNVYLFKSKTNYLSHMAIGVKKSIPQESSSYKSTPRYENQNLFKLSGIIYSKSRLFQIEKMTRYKITIQGTNEVYKGFTGFFDKKNSGSFFNMINAKNGDIITFEILDNNNNVLFSKDITLDEKTSSELKIYTNISNPLNWVSIVKIVLVILFISFLAYQLELFSFRKEKNKED